VCGAAAAARFDPPRRDVYSGGGNANMRLIINGEQAAVEDGATVADLVAQYDLSPLRVAIEVNERLVSRTTFAQTALRDGDRVEIVTLVGGG